MVNPKDEKNITREELTELMKKVNNKNYLKSIISLLIVTFCRR